MGCTSTHKGQLVSAVQLVPSTAPLAQGQYDVGPWVSAEGCDYVDTDFHISDLLFQAQGDYDALVNVTIEQVQQLYYQQNVYSGRLVSVSPGNAYCYRVHGQAVRLRTREIEPAPSPPSP